MAIQNLVSASITPEAKDEILKSLADVRKKLEFLLTLGVDESVRLFKAGKEFGPLLDECHKVAQAHPEILSGVFDQEEYERDYRLIQDLGAIAERCRELTEAIEHTLSPTGWRRSSRGPPRPPGPPSRPLPLLVFRPQGWHCCPRGLFPQNLFHRRFRLLPQLSDGLGGDKRIRGRILRRPGVLVPPLPPRGTAHLFHPPSAASRRAAWFTDARWLLPPIVPIGRWRPLLAYRSFGCRRTRNATNDFENHRGFGRGGSGPGRLRLAHQFLGDHNPYDNHATTLLERGEAGVGQDGVQQQQPTQLVRCDRDRWLG